MVTRVVSSLPPGTAFARYLKSLKYGVEFAQQFRDSPQVSAALGARLSKAAIAGQTLDDAPDLAAFGIYDRDVALLLSGVSAFEACRSRMRELPFDIKVPRQTDAGSGGGWVPEGGGVPVVSYGFDYLRFKPARVGSVYVCSDELLRAPLAELVVRDAALAAVGRTESTLFLDPTIAASGDAPASITFGAPAITATGSVSADLASMLAAVTTAGRGLCWIMRLRDLAYVGAALGAAAPDLPRTLLGVPVILSPNSPAGLVVLADLSEVAYSATGLEADLSDVASIAMESTPTNAIAAGSPAAPTATTLVSLYQSNAVAYKLSRFLNWAVVRAGAVAYMTLDTGSPA